MPYYSLRAEVSQDDAHQDLNGNNYLYAAGELRLVSSSTASSRKGIGMRFIGTIPQGTKSVPSAIIRGYTGSGSGGANVPCNIFLEKPSNAGTSLSTNVFKNTAGAGTGDVISRTLTTNNIAWTMTTVNGSQITDFPDISVLFKELMIHAGAEYADDNDPTDLTATSPTTKDIVNPVIIIRGGTSNSGGNPIEKRFFSYDNALQPDASILTRYKCPQLDITVVPNEDIVIPSDKRTHIAILSDSMGWALQPCAPNRIPGVHFQNSFMTFVANGSIYENALVELESPPGGMVSLIDNNGQAYSIDDPYGAGGAGAIFPQGRDGYTVNGTLKDRLIEAFGVADTDIVIHPFGLGGTTAASAHRTSGIWSSTRWKGDPAGYQSLSEIADPGGDLSTVLTNPLWTFIDETGNTLIDVLRDTSIERLLILYIGGGNDTFATAYQGGSGMLPISRTQSVWDDKQALVKTAYKDIFKFCRDVRQAAGGTEADYLLVGYPNMPTDDPRIPTINVTEGLPTSGAFHRGSFVNVNSPDDIYGGPTGTANGGKMAPYGTGTVNVIPYVPWFMHYQIDQSKVTTNVEGIDFGDLPRPCLKSDLGLFMQIKAFNYCTETFFSEFNSISSDYNAWYSHWAADHYGASFSGFTNTDKWNNAYGFFRGVWNTFPYSSSAAGNLPHHNFKIQIPYICRNITNETVNGALQHVTKIAAEEAMQELRDDEGMSCHYVDLWLSLGSEVGSGDTASAGTWAFFDGAHMTREGSEKYCDALIAGARQNSPILQTLTDWSYEAQARFFDLFAQN